MDLNNKLADVANDMYGIADALDSLANVHDCEDVVAILRDRLSALSIEYAMVHAQVEAQDERELDALNREYVRETA